MSKSIPVVIIIQSRLVGEGIAQILKHRGYKILAILSEMPAVDAKISLLDEHSLLIYYTYRCNQHDFDQIISFKRRHEKCHVVLLVESYDREQRWKVEEIGAVGVLLHSISIEVFIASLRLIVLGGHVFSPVTSPASIRSPAVLYEKAALGQLVMMSGKDDHDALFQVDEISPPVENTRELGVARRNDLSSREIEILAYLVNGNSNKSIARLCGITEATVKAHLKSILRKTEVANRTQAAIWALSNLDLKASSAECTPDHLSVSMFSRVGAVAGGPA